LIDDKDIIYEQSDRRILGSGGREDRLWLELNDRYSLFDWGAMPDRIANRASALSVIAAHIFERLENPEIWQQTAVSPALKPLRSDWLERRWNHLIFCHVLNEHGLATHYRGLAGEEGRPVTMRAAASAGGRVLLDIVRSRYLLPTATGLAGRPVYFYPLPDTNEKRRHLPLEFVFRFGIPKDDPPSQRLLTDHVYSRGLGLEMPAVIGRLFERPVLEFYSSGESIRRLLSIQEALSISGLTPGIFEEAIEISYNIALALHSMFSALGLELWEGKLEYIVGADGLRLADTIGPDRLRLFRGGTELGDGLLKHAYAGSDWAAAVGQAKRQAWEAGSHDWRSICSSELGSEPEPLDAAFKSKADQMYGTLANHILDRQLFENHPTLDEFVASL